MDYETANAIDNLIITGTQAGLAIAAAAGATTPLVPTSAGLQGAPVQSAVSGQVLLAVIAIAGLYFLTRK
jgi:hypothetical protein